jgi:hypothetical protein
MVRFEVDRRKLDNKPIFFQLKFLDSYQFMFASLQSLVEKLPRNKFTLMHYHLGDYDWLYRKGIFPYSWLDSWSKLNENHFPSKEVFHDTLTDSINISDVEYQHAQRVWVEYHCHSFQDYLELYLKCDVLQLADVFENFREMCLHDDGLDAVNYFTIPQLTWDSAFKSTSCTVDLLTDVDMYNFFENGIRGGVVFVNKHHVATNHPSVPETYNANKKHCELLYVDANNLYGHALSMKLPQNQFTWMTKEEMECIDWQFVDTEGDVGYTLEVNLLYPDHIHDSTMDLPFAPEKLTPKSEWLSPFMQEYFKLIYPDKKQYKGTMKLMLTQLNKKKYIVHFKILKFYLQQGMKVTDFCRGIRYHQSAFFAPYIEANSIKRQQTSDKLLQDFYKLKNNSLFGKTMENLRGRKKFQLVNNEKQHQRLCSRDTFISSIYFTPQLVGVHCAKHEVKLCKPIYIGQCVLDNSKLVMYQLKYEKFAQYERILRGKIKLLGGDTDSFFLHLKNIDLDSLLHIMINDKLLDTSNYNPLHALFSNERKAVLGCVKDEATGIKIKEMVLLRPKCYSMQLAEIKASKQRAKGVQSHLVKNILTHDDYLKTWQEKKAFYCNTRRIGSERHQLFTIQKRKLAMSSFEDKRVWLSDNKSVPYGHYSLQTNYEDEIVKLPQNPNLKQDIYENSDNESHCGTKRRRIINTSDNISSDESEDNFYDNEFIL